MSLELHVFPPSPRASKVLLVANHLGLDYELKFVNFLRQEQRTPQYARLNPNMRMPTLRDGDYVLWESNAIMQYLALQKPQGGLLPREERARLDVTRWQFWELAHWDPLCAVFILENLVKPRYMGIHEPDQAALAKAEGPFHAAATVLNEQLRGRSFVTGDTLTVADFSIAAALMVAAVARLPIERHTEIRRWVSSLESLPAWHKTLAQAAATYA